MNMLLPLLACIPLILIIICFTKESKVTGLYKAFGVYGRFSAYITAAFLVGGLAQLVFGLIMPFIDSSESLTASGIALLLLQFVIFFGIGLFMYGRIRRKCPDFLRRKLFVSLLITAFGVAAKICLFFLGFIWKVTGPKDVTLENGQHGYVYNGEVYLSNGTHVGSVNGSDTFTANSNYEGN